MFNLDVDSSDLHAKVDRLASTMKPRQFDNAMYGIFKRTGKHVKTILGKDLPKKYRIKSRQVRSAVKSPKVTTGGGLGGAGCVIPLRGKKLTIGGKDGFPATGGAKGWETMPVKFGGKGKKYRVRARIVKDKRSILPMTMEKYNSENPPFRNLSAPKLNNIAFVRKNKGRGSRLPIVKIVGVAVPQMPLNRSEHDVQVDIKEYLEKQMDQRFRALILNGK